MDIISNNSKNSMNCTAAVLAIVSLVTEIVRGTNMCSVLNPCFAEDVICILSVFVTVKRNRDFQKNKLCQKYFFKKYHKVQVNKKLSRWPTNIRDLLKAQLVHHSFCKNTVRCHMNCVLKDGRAGVCARQRVRESECVGIWVFTCVTQHEGVSSCGYVCRCVPWVGFMIIISHFHSWHAPLQDHCLISLWSFTHTSALVLQEYLSFKNETFTALSYNKWPAVVILGQLHLWQM